MWKITTDGPERELSGEPGITDDPSAAKILDLAQAVASGETAEAAAGLNELMETDDAALDQDTVPLLEPISRWADIADEGDFEMDAMDADAGRIVAYGPGIGLVERGQLLSHAWHMRPLRSFRYRLRRRVSRSRTRRLRGIVNVERIYGRRFGPSSTSGVTTRGRTLSRASTSSLSFLMLRAGPGLVGTYPRLDGTRYGYRISLPMRAAGILIVKPLYRLSRQLHTLNRDP